VNGARFGRPDRSGSADVIWPAPQSLRASGSSECQPAEPRCVLALFPVGARAMPISRLGARAGGGRRCGAFQARRARASRRVVVAGRAVHALGVGAHAEQRRRCATPCPHPMQTNELLLPVSVHALHAPLLRALRCPLDERLGALGSACIVLRVFREDGSGLPSRAGSHLPNRSDQVRRTTHRSHRPAGNT
jgi:hypothetical protein